MPSKPRPSSVVAATTKINNQVLAYAPAAIAAIQAAETSDLSGAAKRQAVIDGILAGARAGETSQNVNVAAISGMIDLIVSVLNATGVFKKR